MAPSSHSGKRSLNSFSVASAAPRVCATARRRSKSTCCDDGNTAIARRSSSFTTTVFASSRPGMCAEAAISGAVKACEWLITTYFTWWLSRYSRSFWTGITSSLSRGRASPLAGSPQPKDAPPAAIVKARVTPDHPPLALPADPTRIPPDSTKPTASAPNPGGTHASEADTHEPAELPPDRGGLATEAPRLLGRCPPLQRPRARRRGHGRRNPSLQRARPGRVRPFERPARLPGRPLGGLHSERPRSRRQPAAERPLAGGCGRHEPAAAYHPRSLRHEPPLVGGRQVPLVPLHPLWLLPGVEAVA